MARGRDANFDGSYETSRYADRSIEQMFTDVWDKGKVITPTDSGGMQKVTWGENGDRVDRWEKGKPGDYPHYGIDEKGNFFNK